MDISKSSFFSVGNYLHNSSNLKSSLLNSSNNITETYLFDKYEFTIFLHNNEHIQIKIINTLTMDHYSDLIEKSFIDNKKYITTIEILYKIIIDAIKKTNTDICSIIHKNTNNKSIQFNLLYNTYYNKFIIPLNIPIENIDPKLKDKLLIQKLVLDNNNLQKKLNNYEIRLSKLEQKFIV